MKGRDRRIENRSDDERGSNPRTSPWQLLQQARLSPARRGSQQIFNWFLVSCSGLDLNVWVEKMKWWTHVGQKTRNGSVDKSAIFKEMSTYAWCMKKWSRQFSLEHPAPSMVFQIEFSILIFHTQRRVACSPETFWRGIFTFLGTSQI